MSNVLPLYRAAAPPAEPPYPTSCKRTMIFGWSVIGVLFGGFGSWASLAPLSSAAIAPGTVVVDSSRKSVQHLEGGVIREILVRDGDLVEAGQVLLRLDGASVRAAIASLQPMLATNKAHQARLEAERDGLDEIVFPKDLIADAKTSVAIAQIVAGQQRIFATRRNALEGQKALNANRLAQSRQRLEGLERQLEVKERERALLRRQLADQKALLSKGYATRRQVASAQRTVQQLESEYTDLHSKVEEAKMLVERYKLEDDQTYKNFIEQVENELYDTEKEYYQVLERMRAIQDQYERLDIRAPVAGVVVNMVAHTVGGVVTPGSPILDIVPNNDKLMIEAQVRPTDIDGVVPGLQADVRFPAFDRTRIPRLAGTVTRVSADRLTTSGGTGYFLVRVEVDEQELKRLKGLTLKPGMPAEVLINKSERTLMGYLLA
ncbi:MAG: HlyD family type I secretion periplasmic adaptor subunit, partial [Geminicoccaceae bacterium]